MSGIPPHDLLLLLAQVCLLLAAAHLLGRLARRAGMPAVAGELLAGVIVGPSLAGAVFPGVQAWLFPPHPAQRHMLDAIAQLGVLLLVGMTGMEMDPRSIGGQRRAIAAVSAAGLLLPVGAGAAVGLLLPPELRTGRSGPGMFALFLGAAVGISSIPVVAKILAEMGLIGRRVGQVIVAAAMVDDVVAWLLLSVVSASVHHGSGTRQVAFAASSVGGVALVSAAAWFVVRRRGDASPRAGAAGEREGATAVVVIILLGSAAVTQALGLEPVLGAFAAGVVLGAVPRFGVRRLEALRMIVFTVLAPLFLATAGLGVELSAFGDPLVLVTLAVVLAVAVSAKFAGAYAGARIGRLDHGESMAVAAGMNARGVVGIVAAGIGVRLGLLTDAMYAVVVTVAIATSVATPALMAWSVRRTATADRSPALRPALDVSADC